jgi:hypothetical protein
VGAAVLDTGQEEKLIRIPGLLCGPDGVTSTCLVEIWDEYSSSGRKYTRCRITNEASELPDGSYILEFADESIRTKRYYNKWELVFLPRRIRPIEAA